MTGKTSLTTNEVGGMNLPTSVEEKVDSVSLKGYGLFLHSRE
jgi:hypothetical protein